MLLLKLCGAIRCCLKFDHYRLYNTERRRKLKSTWEICGVFFNCFFKFYDFPGGSDGKASAYSVGDQDSIPGLGRSGEGNGNSLQYSCLENPMDGGAW